MGEETMMLVLECLLEKRAFWTNVLAESNAEVNHFQNAVARLQIGRIEKALKEIDQM